MRRNKFKSSIKIAGLLSASAIIFFFSQFIKSPILEYSAYVIFGLTLCYGIFHKLKNVHGSTIKSINNQGKILSSYITNLHSLIDDINSSKENEVIKNLTQQLRDSERDRDRGNSQLKQIQSNLSNIVAQKDATLIEVQKLYFGKLQRVKDDVIIELKNEQVQIEASSAKIGSTLGKHGLIFGVNADAYYGEKYHRDIFFGEKFILRSNSVAAREIVARSATNLQFGMTELIDIVRATRGGLIGPGMIPVIQKWNKKSLFSLARIMAAQNLMLSDKFDSISIFHTLYFVHGLKSFSRADIFLYLETLQDEGDVSRFNELFDEAQALLGSETQFVLLANNSLVAGSEKFQDVESKWLEGLNAAYRAAGLLELSLSPGTVHVMDRLVSNLPQRCKEGPLVSIIMPTFNGSDHILTAVKSVLSQTWVNLELIIVDDGSEENHWNSIQSQIPLDSRIRLFRLPENQGAYFARNYALARAKGDYITVHDDDDWSHPEKIERQMSEILKSPDSVGNMSFMTRIDEDCFFLRINDNPEFNQKNYSSLLVPRNLLNQVGSWDAVTRGGDAEFHERLQAITGSLIGSVQTPPLSFARSRSGSLTSGEIRKGFISHGRQSYSLSYLKWHKDLSEGNAAIASIGSEGFPFKRPESLVAGRKNEGRGNYDIVYATDFRFSGGNTSLIASEIRAALDMGLRVAIAQLESPTLRSRRPMDVKIDTILRENDVAFITVEDEVSTEILVLRHPTIMQYADNMLSNVRAKNVYLIVNNPPIGRDGVESVFDVSVCEVNANRAFARDCVVFPESTQTREICLSMSPNVNYSDTNWPGFIDTAKFERSRRGPDSARKPIVGRHSRDHRLKWPDTASDFEYAYSRPDIFNTVILGGADSIAGMLASSSLSNIVVRPFGEVDPSEYLATVDFWVYFHSADWTESFGIAIAEAMASGAIVILPHYLEAMFGVGAVYAYPSEVAAIVDEYWRDEAGYLEQSKRGIEYIRHHYSIAAYQRKLRDFLSVQSVAVSTETFFE